MKRNKKLKIAGVVILILILTVAGIRFFSDEDDWVCDNGQWVKHGHPSSPVPTQVCMAKGEFGGVSLNIEYAITEEARENGLSDRASIPGDYGMLFVFSKDQRYGFWMKDMLAPIDIFWLDNKGQVVSIAQDVATSTYPNVFYPSKSARYVLETAAGFASRNSIATSTFLLLKNLPIVSE